MEKRKENWRKVPKRRNSQPKIGGETRFRWKPTKDVALTAGGLLPYDKDGIWVIEEHSKRKPDQLEYTDLGGRYHFDDGDIYATIAREFNEEVYYSAEITRKQVLKISEISETIHIDGYQKKPVYACVLAPVFCLESMGIKMNPKQFLIRREIVLRQNPDVPKSYYRPLKLEYISHADIANNLYTLSNRLKCILKESKVLSKYIEMHK